MSLNSDTNYTSDDENSNLIFIQNFDKFLMVLD